MSEKKPEYTGGSVEYYKATITLPTTYGLPAYTAECNDLIKVLQLRAAQANIFKAIWRTAASEVMGTKKDGHNAKYDAEKILFFAFDVAQEAGVDIQKIVDHRGYGKVAPPPEPQGTLVKHWQGWKPDDGEWIELQSRMLPCERGAMVEVLLQIEANQRSYTRRVRSAGDWDWRGREGGSPIVAYKIVG